VFYFWKEGEHYKHSTSTDNLPLACFAIKAPPKAAIQTLPWPDLSTLKLAEEEGQEECCEIENRLIRGAAFYTSCKVNDERVQHFVSEHSYTNPSHLDLNPLVWVRLARVV